MLTPGGVALFASLSFLVQRGEPLELELGGSRIVVHSEPEALSACGETEQGRLLPGVIAYRRGWLAFPIRVS